MRERREIEVVADWRDLEGPCRMGVLTATPARGREVFSFEYDDGWLASGQHQRLDPSLQLYPGPQYPPGDREQFGVFLDSAPDRWGRVLMKRREAQLARAEDRPERVLVESDYLLGVHDAHRIGALRYRLADRFLDDNADFASPPWTSLRELQHASMQLEREGAEGRADYARWLRMLVSPGGSLGGARPKASVRDEQGSLWIAKFPSRHDERDVGAWEMVVHDLARAAGVDVPEARIEVFGSRDSNPKRHRTFLTRRFDRTPQDPQDRRRIHFASAMTLLDRIDGLDGSEGASYLEIAEALMQYGVEPSEDLEQLWRRIVFSICVSNVDDHLRNHGFLLGSKGWRLAPAYDLNADPQGNGLTLNISETDNAQDLDLAIGAAPWFRLSSPAAVAVLAEVKAAVSTWRSVAEARGVARIERDAMARAFRVVDVGA
jgi:serine/threonine-protein kinase HipA